jgi:hypothetical protein
VPATLTAVAFGPSLTSGAMRARWAGARPGLSGKQTKAAATATAVTASLSILMFPLPS